jgi:hypothetical protein
MPAAMRPWSGSSMTSLAALGTVTDALGRAAAIPAWVSGMRRIWRARARLGRRRMKPRSSSAEISRWTPDLDLSCSASFISSNEGETPFSFSLWWM